MTGLSANIAQELTCPICGEIAINPVRFKVVNEQKQGVCNDIFCEQCVIINFYHIQGTPQSKQPKCPVCNQKIFTDGAMSVSDYYISDKITKKIVHKILNSEPQSNGYPCKYMCGFIGKNVSNIEAHYDGPETDCNKKIIKCDTKYCFHLDI